MNNTHSLRSKSALLALAAAVLLAACGAQETFSDNGRAPRPPTIPIAEERWIGFKLERPSVERILTMDCDGHEGRIEASRRDATTRKSGPSERLKLLTAIYTEDLDTSDADYYCLLKDIHLEPELHRSAAEQWYRSIPADEVAEKHRIAELIGYIYEDESYLPLAIEIASADPASELDDIDSFEFRVMQAKAIGSVFTAAPVEPLGTPWHEALYQIIEEQHDPSMRILAAWEIEAMGETCSDFKKRLIDLDILDEELERITSSAWGEPC